jgi:CubicO group peptidase (beta-lactamase class C family)
MSIHSLPRTHAVLQAGIDSGLHPGAQVYVSMDGQVIVDGAMGLARPDVAMTRDTLTLWMSAGKPVTAVAVMQLVDRGLISLHTKVADVIPEFGVNGKGPITLWHILTHTAGFRGPLNNFTPGTWEEILQRVYALRQEPGWVPGEKAGYHIGSSWFVLGELVRKLDGRSIDRYVREAIFAKLGEHDAYVGLPEAVFDTRGQEIALMYVTEKEPTTDWPGNSREANTLPRPGANARGSIRALGRIYADLLKSIESAEDNSPPLAGMAGAGGIGNDEGFRKKDESTSSLIPYPSSLPPGPHPNPLPEGEGTGTSLLTSHSAKALASRQRVGMIDHTFKQVLDWGLGVMIDSKQYAGEHQYGFGPHASADTFGHSGNQSSCAFCDPKHKLVVAWTCNGMPGEVKHQARASAINRAIYEDLGLA